MLRTIPTNCGSVDEMLEGGFLLGAISLVYGEAETGKTTLAMQTAVSCARMEYKTVFIDSDDTFSLKRLAEIAQNDLDKFSPLIMLMKPKNFEEQGAAIAQLEQLLTEKVKLVIVDTITSLYRIELGEEEHKRFRLNRELNRQIASLAQITKTYNVATLLTSQVRSFFRETQSLTEPVATRVVKFWSDTIISLKPTEQTSVIKAILEKHSRRKHLKNCYITIKEQGIQDYNPLSPT